MIPGGGDPPAKVSAALPAAGTANASSGGAQAAVVPYLSRDPAVSLVQSALTDALREQGVADQTPVDRGLWSAISRPRRRSLHPGTAGDVAPPARMRNSSPRMGEPKR